MLNTFCFHLGWQVTGADRDPIWLKKVTDGAAREKCVVQTVRMDLELDMERTRTALAKSNGYGLVHVARYLHRPMMPILADLIAVGGFVVYHTFMVPSMGKPKKPKFLLQVGELKSFFGEKGFRIWEYLEDKLPDGRPAQYICAQKIVKS
jgi:hypothetical protein